MYFTAKENQFMILIKYEMFMKGRRHIQEIFQKFKFFPNNILGVLHEKISSKCNEYDS